MGHLLLFQRLKEAAAAELDQHLRINTLLSDLKELEEAQLQSIVRYNKQHWVKYQD
jgi:hypothetical protein